MKKHIALALMGMAFITGCGSSGTSSPTAVSGVVADGYLENALVFFDKNKNYQLDEGEPFATTDEHGAYTLTVSAEEIGLYPIVAIAIKDQTIDQDTGLPVDGTYVLCLPEASVSGIVSNFISPMSTLLREKLVANPDMTLSEAVIQLRNQLNMPLGMNILGNYVEGSLDGEYQQQYQAMHRVAQQMAGLMADQAPLVMNEQRVYAERFRNMMGEMNQNLSLIATNAASGDPMNSTVMNQIRAQMQERVEGVPVTGGFANYSGMFRNHTSHSYFWNYSGGRMRPSGQMGMMW